VPNLQANIRELVGFDDGQIRFGAGGFFRHRYSLQIGNCARDH